MFKKQKLNAADERLREEKLYEQVSNEVSQGIIKSGLWAKALAENESDEAKAKAMYIHLRVQSIIDESVINQEVTEEYEKIKLKEYEEIRQEEKRLQSKLRSRGYKLLKENDEFIAKRGSIFVKEKHFKSLDEVEKFYEELVSEQSGCALIFFISLIVIVLMVFGAL